MKAQQHNPKHIAIIMDGNRRWAKERNLPILEGHRRVANSVLEPLIKHASEMGIEYLTFWAWSTENWSRDLGEVKGIMSLLRWGFGHFGEKLHKNGVRIRMIGDISKFDRDIKQQITALIEKTKHNKAITAVFALNYGGRDEMLRAMEKMNNDKKTKALDVTPETFSQYLDTAGIPDPELIVRTGGEKRLSGFLLWQCEYSELYFADWHMPDFTIARFNEIVRDFETRQRRFGK